MASNSLPFVFSPDYSSSSGHWQGYRMWTSVAAGATRTTFDGMSFITGSSGVYRRDIEDSTALIVVAKHVNEFSAGSFNQAFIQFYNGSGTEVLALHINSSNYFEAKRGSTSLATSTHQADGNVHTVELSMSFHDTTGDIALRVDTVEQFALSGIDTLNGSGPVTRVDFRVRNVGADFVAWRDAQIRTRTGGANTGWRGPRRLYFLAPTADASGANDWDEHAGATLGHYDAVNEANADGDTSALKTSVDGEEERFTYQDLADVSATGSPASVAMFLVSELPASGSAHVRALISSNGTDSEGEDMNPGDSTYRGQQYVWDTDPSGGGAWTGSRVDGLVGGFKSTAA